MRPIRDTDFKDIDLWMTKRKFPILDGGFYGRNGWIEEGVAAGFLTCTDTQVALMENFVTNPDAPAFKRGLALIEITKALETIAKEKGYKYAMAYSNVETIHKIAENLGYKLVAEPKIHGKEL